MTESLINSISALFFGIQLIFVFKQSKVSYNKNSLGQVYIAHTKVQLCKPFVDKCVLYIRMQFQYQWMTLCVFHAENIRKIGNIADLEKTHRYQKPLISIRLIDKLEHIFISLSRKEKKMRKGAYFDIPTVTEGCLDHRKVSTNQSE